MYRAQNSQSPIPEVICNSFPLRSKKDYFTNEFALLSDPNVAGDYSPALECMQTLAEKTPEAWFIHLEAQSGSPDSLQRHAHALQAVLHKCNCSRLFRRIKITGMRLANIYRVRNTFWYCSDILCKDWFHTSVVAYGLASLLGYSNSVWVTFRPNPRVRSVARNTHEYLHEFHRKSKWPYGSIITDVIENSIVFTLKNGGISSALLAQILQIFGDKILSVSFGQCKMSISKSFSVDDYEKSCRLTQQRSFRFKPYSFFGEWFDHKI